MLYYKNYYEHNPPQRNFEPIIISKLINLYVLCHVRISKFPKRDQYTIGKRIEELVLEILSLSTMAQYKKGKK